MKTFFIKPFILLLLLISLDGRLFADSQQIGPPPITCINFHEDTGQWRATFITMGLGDSGDAIGGAFEYTMSPADDGGHSLNLMYLNMDLGEMMGTTPFLSIGCNFIYELVGGEKKDIAGEIVKKEFSLATFFGMNISYMSMSTDYMDMTMFGLGEGGGVVAEIPLGGFISFVPYISFTLMLSMTDMTMDIMGTTYSDVSSSTTTSFRYGCDIVLTPFRNAKDWKISVGTALGMIAANEGSNSMITFAITREWGKHYKSTTIGPVLN